MPERRKRFEPSAPRYGVTPPKLRLLAYVAECGMLTTRQCARIAGTSRKSAHNRLADLFHAGLTDRTVVPYASVAPPGAATKYNGPLPSELIHVPTKKALAMLLEFDMVGEDAARRKVPAYGPDNFLFVAHEVLAREVRVWLEQCSRADGGECEWWVHGEDAHLPPLEPDALFIYRLPGEPARRRVGLVEADMGTERRDRWEKKAAQYAELLASGRLADVTGGRRGGKIIAVARTPERRDWIAEVLAATPVGEHAYCACRDDLEEGGVSRPAWRRPGRAGLRPFWEPENLL